MLAYYSLLWIVSSVVGERVDVVDESQGSHMGSSPRVVAYVFAQATAVVIPGVVVAVLIALKQRLSAHVVAVVVALPIITTAWFYLLTDYHSCIPGRVLPDDSFFFFGTMASLVAVVAAVGYAKERAVSPRAEFSNIPIALAAASVWALMMVIQGESCSGISSQVTRGYSVFMFPLWLILTYPSVLIGVGLRRLLTANASR